MVTCQFPVSADIGANGEWIRGQMREADEKGADLVHFSKCVLSGYAGVDYMTMAEFDWKK
ncbi:MAG: hypothetical protein J7K65_05435 [Planctomycetes bacterium]|nr:hypothetical protein [Planctomycetota bacterium]